MRILQSTMEPLIHHLSTYDPNSDTWAHSTFSGWSTVNNVSYGGIGSYQNYIYATDMATFGDEGADAAKGIVRFDINDYSAQRFAVTSEYIDLTIGLDGMLYGLSNGVTVDVYDPLTMGLSRTLNLAVGVRGVAINATGEIFGASGMVTSITSILVEYYKIA